MCDGNTDGGGWIVISRRIDGKVDFNRNWADYKDGFGSFESDFWLGNDKISEITSKGKWELKVTIRSKKSTATANYATFSVGDESTNYVLNIAGFSGKAKDSLSYHNGMKFTTPDKDNDAQRKVNCATTAKSGWWFNKCEKCNLNGAFGVNNGNVWRTFSGKRGLLYSEMKIRRTDA